MRVVTSQCPHLAILPQLEPLKFPLPRIFFQSIEFKGGSSGILPEPAPDPLSDKEITKC